MEQVSWIIWQVERNLLPKELVFVAKQLISVPLGIPARRIAKKKTINYQPYFKVALAPKIHLA